MAFLRKNPPCCFAGHPAGRDSPGKETIRCFVRSIDIQVLAADGKVRKLLSFTDRVYFYDNLVLYRRDGHIDSTINGETVLSEDRYSYFIFAKDSAYGIQYNTFNQKRLSVDSVKKLAVMGFGLADLLKQGTTRLVSSTMGSRTGRPAEVYCDLGTDSPSDKDSLYL